jgi:hypothetical protein
MRPLATIALAVLLPASIGAGAGAQELKTPLPAVRPPVDVSALGPMRDALGRPLESVVRQTPFARAIGEAWKKDASEANLKAWSEVLVKCQEATNPAWSSALMRAEPQQAHCFSY